MPNIDLEILDQKFQTTTNTTHGTATTYVDMTIGGVQIFTGIFAVVDTGADYTVISPSELLPFADQIQEVDKKTITDPVLASTQHPVYLATLEIEQLKDPREIYVIAKEFRPAVLIGRNLLAHYKFVYDPPNKVFTLETP